MFITIVTAVTVAVTHFMLVPYLEARNERDKHLYLELVRERRQQINPTLH